MATKTDASTSAAQSVPRELAKLVEKAKPRIDGKYCYGLPHNLTFVVSDKYKLELVALGNMELFTRHGVDVAGNSSWIPFAELTPVRSPTDTGQFLAVSTIAPYSVGL